MKSDIIRQCAEHRLSSLRIGESATIKSLCGVNEIRAAHLTDLGFIPGESVTPLFVSPFGDPTAYLLGGCVKIGLRRLEAENILVTGRV